MRSIAREFYENTVSRYGAEGKKWFDDLPQIIKSYQKKWNLSEVTPVENLTYHYVGLILDKALKIGFEKEEMQQEIKSLKHFQTLQIFDYDDYGILMERCVPGVSLTHMVPESDFEATEIAIDLLKKIYKPSHEFTGNVSEWLKTIYENHPLSKEYLEKARLWAEELLGIAEENIVLHGDFDHGNILQNHDHYVIIDGNGIMGERCYDIACFIRNPLKLMVQNLSLILGRVEQFSQAFEIDKQRILKWCFVQGMLSACWRAEDNQDATDVLMFCEYIKNLYESKMNF